MKDADKAASPAVPAQINETLDARIREIFLANGFTIKEGQTDLKPYVYQAAHALLWATGALAAVPAQSPDGRTIDKAMVRRLAIQHGLIDDAPAQSGEREQTTSTGSLAFDYANAVVAKKLGTSPVEKVAQAEPVLDKPAKVGGGRFGVGVKWSTVIGAAQRHYEYEVTPEKEAARIARAGEVIESIRRGEYLSEPAQPDRCYAPSCGMWDGNDSCTCQRAATWRKK